MILSTQINRKEALPLMRKIAASDRFKSWSAPNFHKDDNANLQAYARKAVAALENQKSLSPEETPP